ncbi:hypothetical protein [Kluyvera intermedia]|uniref:hypothetical protein n=1 Tax=Kluyvera intermedia TaxID=61648 RepID=UPI001554618F|nr:hypothetical protein [Kluyvera intermedia]
MTDSVAYFCICYFAAAITSLVAVYGGGVLLASLVSVPFLAALGGVFWYTRIRQ